MSYAHASARLPERNSSTTTCTIPSSVRRTYNEAPMTMAMPFSGLSPPSKGFFAPSSVPTTRSELVPSGVVSSAVPSRGRRRESITGQMRRKASETTTAAGGGASGLSIPRSPNSSNGRSIPLSARSPRVSAADMGMGSLSTSFGAAAEALSLSSSKASDATVAPESFAQSQSIKTEPRSTGHSHLGVECFGPSSLDNMPMPSMSMMTSGAVMDGKRERRASVSSTGTVGEDDENKGKHEQLHRCESCAKVYRHPSCLIKHRWEHTVYWKEASKFLMSKHQQVQLLEAAAILVGMDCSARSLPEEKALWPAAVSPPASGLLGSEQINFDKLMASKRRNTVSTNASSSPRGPTPSLMLNDSSDGSTASNYEPSQNGALSPLHGMGQMRLGSTDGYAKNRGRYQMDDGDIDGATVNGSGSDRADRSGSADMDEEDDDERSRDLDQGQERYGMDAGGDVMAHMEMDDVN